MSMLSPGRNLVLIGLMGAGKTTVGRLLAQRLERPFVDTDDVVERHSGRTIAQLFAEGERVFRDQEAAAVRHVSALRGQVIAVGGGAVGDPMSVTNLRSTGDMVVLDAMASVLAGRVRDPEGRPMLAGAEDLTSRLAELQQARREDYRRAALFTVDTSGRTPDEVADEILEWARTRPGLLARGEAPG
ncbi:shikimate kinase [soil metagenome]